MFSGTWDCVMIRYSPAFLLWTTCCRKLPLNTGTSGCLWLAPNLIKFSVPCYLKTVFLQNQILKQFSFPSLHVVQRYFCQKSSLLRYCGCFISHTSGIFFFLVVNSSNFPIWFVILILCSLHTSGIWFISSRTARCINSL